MTVNLIKIPAQKHSDPADWKICDDGFACQYVSKCWHLGQRADPTERCTCCRCVGCSLGEEGKAVRLRIQAERKARYDTTYGAHAVGGQPQRAG